MTPKQKLLLDFIKAYHVSHGGVSPSFREMSRAMGVHLSEISRRLASLEEAGHIVRAKNRARRIIILRPSQQGQAPIARLADHIAKQDWCGAGRETVLAALREVG